MYLTWESDLPTRDETIETRCFDSWYVGELTKDTIGCMEIPG